MSLYRIGESCARHDSNIRTSANDYLIVFETEVCDIIYVMHLCFCFVENIRESIRANVM